MLQPVSRGINLPFHEERDLSGASNVGNTHSAQKEMDSGIPVHEFQPHVSRTGRRINPPGHLKDYYAIDAIALNPKNSNNTDKSVGNVTMNHDEAIQPLQREFEKIMVYTQRLESQMQENSKWSSEKVVQMEKHIGSLDLLARDADFQVRVCAGQIELMKQSWQASTGQMVKIQQSPKLPFPFSTPLIEKTKSGKGSKLPVASWHITPRRSYSK